MKILFILLVQFFLFFAHAVETNESVLQLPTQLHLEKEKSLSAGDVVELEVNVGPELPQIEWDGQVAVDKGETVPNGDGRILWAKKVEAKKNGETSKFVFGLTTYKPGSFKIGPIVLKKSGQVYGQSEAKEVEYSKLEKKEFDLYPPIGVSLPTWVIVVLGLLVLLVLIGLALAIRAILKRKKKVSIQEPVIIPLDPFPELEKMLNSVESQQYLEKKLFKRHYFGISEAFKHFLTRELRIPAEDRTSAELKRELRDLGLTEDLARDFDNLFDHMDLVKFTDQEPMIGEAQALGSRVLDIARRTLSYSGGKNAI